MSPRGAIGAAVGALVLVVPALARGQVLPVQPPATPAEGWGMVVAVLVAALLGLGGLLRWVAARHLRALDETVAEQKTIGGSLREVFAALRAHREEAEARARSAEERHEQRHGDVIERLEALRAEIGVREQLNRIETSLGRPSSPEQHHPEPVPPTARGAARRGG